MGHNIKLTVIIRTSVAYIVQQGTYPESCKGAWGMSLAPAKKLLMKMQLMLKICTFYQ
jgi:hypothetical protein